MSQYIGDVSTGGTVGPLTTPKLVIEGLTTTARAFNTPQGYGHRESFTFASISLDLLDNTVVQNLPPELQTLLAPLDQVSSDAGWRRARPRAPSVAPGRRPGRPRSQHPRTRSGRPPRTS